MKQYTRKRTLILLCDIIAKEMIEDQEKLKGAIMYGNNSLRDYLNTELEELYEVKTGDKITIKN